LAVLTLSSLQAQAALNKNGGMQEGKYQSRKHSHKLQVEVKEKKML
jgi:hypothetical protein